MKKLIQSPKIIGLLFIFGFLTINVALPATANAQSNTFLPVQTIAQAVDDEPTAGVANETCEGSSVIGWILCGTVRLLYSGIDFFYNSLIVPGLQIDPLNNSGAEGSPEAYVFSVWNSFRVLANILFIFIFLLAIIGQSFSWFFTPYELKRIIPRLAIGAIGIQLSWYFVGFTIDFFNILGAGIQGLILAPTEGAGFNIGGGPIAISGDNEAWSVLGDGLGLLGPASVNTVEEIGGVVVGGGAVIAASVIGLKGVIMGLTLLLLPIIMLVVVAALIIAIRKILILILVAIAPIAFVFWILPGTQGIFKQWWDLLWKSLLMYPLIIGLIAGGRLTSSIVGDLDALPGILQVLMGIVALFVPYALIPSTFKFAGNVLGTIGGAGGGASKKFQDRVFGDPHSQFSFRGRRKEAVGNYKMDKFARKVDKNSDSMNAIHGASTAAQAKRAKGRKGKSTFAGKGSAAEWLGRNIDKRGDGLAGMGAGAGAILARKAGNPRRALGALATNARLRMGPGLSRAMAERAEHQAKTVQNLGGMSSETLIALISGDEKAINMVTGKEIGYANAMAALGGSGRFFGAEPLGEDRAAVQNAMIMLAGRLATRPQMDKAREMLMKNHHLDDFAKEEIWKVFRVNDYVDRVAPELRYTTLDGQYEFEQSSDINQAQAQAQAAEFVNRIHSKKTVRRDLASARAGLWDSFEHLDEVVTGMTDDGLDGINNKTRVKYNSINASVEDVLMEEVGSASFEPRFKDKLEDKKLKIIKEIVRDEKGNAQMMDVKDAAGKVVQVPVLKDKRTSRGYGVVYDLTDKYTLDTLYGIPTFASTAEGSEARLEHVMKTQKRQKSEFLDKMEIEYGGLDGVKTIFEANDATPSIQSGIDNYVRTDKEGKAQRGIMDAVARRFRHTGRLPDGES